jgi:Protein of unknown function (DUF3168)
MNAEATIGDYLRDDPTLVSLDVRVAGEAPRGMTLPWVIVRQYDGTPEAGSGSRHLHVAYLQLDCYAGATATREHRGQAMAWDVADAVCSALDAIANTSFEDCVVTDATWRKQRIPDPDLEPAQERVIVLTTVSLHAQELIT